VNADNTLLYYAVSGGQELPGAVRDPIIKARVALDRGETLSDDDEGKFLGMVSGLTLQWLVVRADGTIAGGVTPAVLAFIGGYSVEMLFAVMDRLVQLVTGRMRSPSRPGQPTARAKRDLAPAGAPGGRRNRVREIPTNGAAASQRAASPVAALAAVRVESN